ncbi:MAG: hypothetical protein ABR503_07120 [Chitinophagaceae bacterium]
MKFPLFICSCFCLAFLGCQKDNSGSSAPTKTELITKSSWKYDNAGIDIDKNGVIDIPPPAGTLEACATDNFLLLASNGTGNVDEGPTKCNAGSPQSVALTWSFANNETALNLNGGGVLGINGQFKILELTDIKLSLSKDTTIPFFGPVALIANLKH